MRLIYQNGASLYIPMLINTLAGVRDSVGARLILRYLVSYLSITDSINAATCSATRITRSAALRATPRRVFWDCMFLKHIIIFH
ncbi:unknown [Choristoneura fumiferana multiple nucleopolyhedrovirus]|uniref:Uncharacterized protein n=1 Tax=Choristoneura fumiferana nuclear polyhedrosis virus TaxID=208973 RepID=Q7TLN2_NPVCF|nr:unknown [Choristoneura fumiferana multiple nucleopolyhedrovirus]AAP29902.1 unknown [Choristoneura fumiferana multiple nucleopolyhedrovirus]